MSEQLTFDEDFDHPVPLACAGFFPCLPPVPAPQPYAEFMAAQREAIRLMMEDLEAIDEDDDIEGERIGLVDIGKGVGNKYAWHCDCGAEGIDTRDRIAAGKRMTCGSDACNTRWRGRHSAFRDVGGIGMALSAPEEYGHE